VEGEYEWLREYLYEANAGETGAKSTFLLQFEGGACKYLELSNKLTCKKRTRSSQGSDISKEFTRPSKVPPPFPVSFISTHKISSSPKC